MTNPITIKEKKYPVVEIFGPTIQGEGYDQGVPCHFIRFGGCDYRCGWCDTPYAVLPEEVRQAQKMTDDEILVALAGLTGNPCWIIISGGNPALHDLSTLCDRLHEVGYLIAVETQGSRWRNWMSKVDRLCVSPKPPSSGMKVDWTQVQSYLNAGMSHKDPFWLFVKVVVFDDLDFEFARFVRQQLSDATMYLSAGNDAGRTVGNPTREDTRTDGQVKESLLSRYEWLVNKVLSDSEMCHADIVVQAQQHVLLWGNKQGV